MTKAEQLIEQWLPGGEMSKHKSALRRLGKASEDIVVLAQIAKAAMDGLVRTGRMDGGWCPICMFQCPDADCVHGECPVGDALHDIEVIARKKT